MQFSEPYDCLLPFNTLCLLYALLTDEDQDGVYNSSYYFIFLFIGFDATYKPKMVKGRRGNMARGTVSLLFPS